VPQNPTDPNQQGFFVNQFTNFSGTTVVSNQFGFSNRLSSDFTNDFVGSGGFSNLALEDIQLLLVSLQSDIELALPALVSLTSGIDVNAGGNVAPGTVAPANTDAAVANPNVGANVATTVTRPAPVTVAPGRVGGVGAGANNPAVPGQPNQRILAPGQVHQIGGAFVGMVGTNTLAMNPDTFQMLLFLRNNLQQTRNLLQALNGSAMNAAAPGTPGLVFTNRFSVMTNRFMQGRQGVLTPTAR
jgi:hypothetical protein